jgi:hypothetical protein
VINVGNSCMAVLLQIHHPIYHRDGGRPSKASDDLPSNFHASLFGSDMKFIIPK